MPQDPPPIPTTSKPYPCSCPPNSPGTVLLFYRYYANIPLLPPSHQDSALTPDSLSKWHHQLASHLHLTGKLRLAREGFNITIAGPTPSIERYIASCCRHWSFSGLDLQSDEARRKFFKPTAGCGCVFPSLSVKVCEEITPMAVSNYAPADWGAVRELEPVEWDAMIRAGREEVVLLDVRNHYESALGYFVDGGGREAVRPLVRRFSQFPLYVRRRGLDGWVSGNGDVKRKVLSYCTGGIRCEKATRFMRENLSGDADVEVYTLKGGIAAYISWVDCEIREGRMVAEDSLFKGKNYVFDGRGSIGLEVGQNDVVGRCIGCDRPEDTVQKCDSTSCHLELIVCPDCKGRGVVCCQDCRCLDTETVELRIGARPMCQCEKDREAKLWGSDDQKVPGKQGWKTKRRKESKRSEAKDGVRLQIQVIQPEA